MVDCTQYSPSSPEHMQCLSQVEPATNNGQAPIPALKGQVGELNSRMVRVESRVSDLAERAGETFDTPVAAWYEKASNQVIAACFTLLVLMAGRNAMRLNHIDARIHRIEDQQGAITFIATQTGKQIGTLIKALGDAGYNGAAAAIAAGGFNTRQMVHTNFQALVDAVRGG